MTCSKSAKNYYFHDLFKVSKIIFFDLPKVIQITYFYDLFKVNKLTYSESEPNFSFAINLVSDFHSASESESDSSLGLINLDICIFFTLYLHSSK